METNKKIYKQCLSLILLLSLILMPYSFIRAASATINIKADTESAAVGDEITVSLSISSDAMLGDFEAYITYNADILEFESDASFIAGGEGLLKLTDKNSVNKESSRKYIMRFTAKAIGVSEIAIKDKAEIYEYETGTAMSVSSNRLDIRVSAAKTASDNNNLKSLKINPGSLKPKFDPKITEYTTKIDYESNKIILSAVPEDDNAKVTVDGNENLSVGNNKITVKVKAESGEMKEYIITATRNEEKEKDTEETIETVESDDNLDSVSKQYGSIEDKAAEMGNLLLIKDGEDIYIQNGYRYQILTPGEDVAIPGGYSKTSLILDDVTVTAYTPENDLNSDFLILYAKNEAGETGFYQYDRVEETLQRYTKSREGNKVVMSGNLMQSEEYKAKLTTMGIVLAILGCVCIILSVALIRLYLKNREEE
ncbi:hypothetical protein Ana3638_10640 [Anaerocolumna sedimenticola]|uniref:Cadherin-like beta-sandwich-like domain-containing protein n=1 Tax=Anaerocolumna sedimenticola TaxID=2696063 RepID=A0A6P1TL75_9FIRM|nr:cadherin-like beta sandwich domain-containing protein [Anaerocolumna sedimenticola]QHQ61173.1 hypothetical protein Ana3638_10640 [Anaerocolumna sedimenticola]